MRQSRNALDQLNHGPAESPPPHPPWKGHSRQHDASHRRAAARSRRSSCSRTVRGPGRCWSNTGASGAGSAPRLRSHCSRAISDADSGCPIRRQGWHRRLGGHHPLSLASGHPAWRNLPGTTLCRCHTKPEHHADRQRQQQATRRTIHHRTGVDVPMPPAAPTEPVAANRSWERLLDLSTLLS